MTLEQFVIDFRTIFDETDTKEITSTTNFRELEEWSSLTALSVIAMVNMKYAKTISGLEIKECKTTEELYNLVQSK